jgi:hypothetical protein
MRNRKLWACLASLALLCGLGGCGPGSDHLAPAVTTAAPPAVNQAAPVAASSGTDYTAAAVGLGAGMLAGHLLTRPSAPPAHAPVVQHITVKKTVNVYSPRPMGGRSGFAGGRRGR